MSRPIDSDSTEAGAPRGGNAARRHGSRVDSISFAQPATIVAVAVVAVLSASRYFVKHPVITTPDTAGFYEAAGQILRGNPFHEVRTPGYPLLLALTGRDHEAATLAQAALFVCSTVMVWFLGSRIVGRWWGGVVPAVAFAVSPYVLEYARMLSSELLACFLLLAVACVGVAFGTRRIGLGGVAVGALAFTKLEFLLLPLVLLLVVALARPGRRVLTHAALATAVIYALLGTYAIGNAIVNDYAGISVIPRMSRLGKVMQYRMQSDAPGEYAETTRAIDAYLESEAASFARGSDPSPFALAERHPELLENNWRLAGEYATATIANAPAEFSWRTLRLLFEDAWVVLLSVGWLLLWALRGARIAPIGLTSLLLLYDLVLTAIGGYTDFGRLHLASYSLRVLVLALTPVALVCLVRSRRGPSRVRTA